jgi:hypothetical protein
VGVRRLSGAIPGASCRKSLAANFRFQGCCLPRVHRAHFERQFGVRTSTLDPTSDGTVGSAPRGKANEQGIVPYACAGACSPSARHWSGQAIGRSTRRLRPKPRGRRPSTAALRMSGARKASDRVIRIERSLLSSREAIDSNVRRGSERSSSSQRWASRRASSRIARALAGIGRP